MRTDQTGPFHEMLPLPFARRWARGASLGIAASALLVILLAGVARADGSKSCLDWGNGTGTCPGMRIWVDCARYSLNPISLLKGAFALGKLDNAYYQFGHLMVSAQVDCGNGPQLLDFAVEQSQPYETYFLPAR